MHTEHPDVKPLAAAMRSINFFSSGRAEYLHRINTCGQQKGAHGVDSDVGCTRPPRYIYRFTRHGYSETGFISSVSEHAPDQDSDVTNEDKRRHYAAEEDTHSPPMKAFRFKGSQMSFEPAFRPHNVFDDWEFFDKR